ncbi:MAG: cysteine desulfurase [Flavobacteriales bacterium]|nr:cysteine desulfurase [Flavobacteriales bacterium]MCB9195757.1 cysteine desulfurase [Flavobacteriales bacterium]MCB9198811.1 cysteine desulfurase [Flavobacteriales bacterium]
MTLAEIRKQFPILEQQVNGKPLIYFDNGATAQKPLAVIHSIDDYYQKYNSNIHRGVHHLSQLATNRYEESRDILQKFVNARKNYEIIFTAGTTGGINLVASSFGKKFLDKGDEVIISAMEHHSNIVPWQMICEERGANLRVIPINDKGELIYEEYIKLLSHRTKLVAITHISNTMGTINPVRKMIVNAHEIGAKVLIDAAQSVPHMKLDVQELDCDFLVFSAHKMFGPTGVGVLYGKEELLNEMPPYQGGGDMIKEVTFEKTTYNCLPHKFEAGTPNIAGGIATAEAVKFMNEVGFDFIEHQEHELLTYATKRLSEIEGVRIIGTSSNKASVISFVVAGTHPFDVGTLLDQMGIAVRTGHHCTQPLMNFFGIPGTIRASFAFYNTKEEVDVFIAAIKKAIMMLS